MDEYRTILARAGAFAASDHEPRRIELQEQMQAAGFWDEINP